MTDDTRSLRPVGQPPALPEALRDTLKQLNDAAGLMREYQTALRQRGMNLPAGAYETVKQAAARLEALDKSFTTQRMELRQFRGLAETTAVINSTLELDALLRQVMDSVIQLTGAERGYILLRNPSTGELEYQVARGIDREQLARDEFKVSSSIVREVFTTGQPVITDNAFHDPRFEQQQSIVGFALRSILAVPLRVQDDPIGVVYCDNRIMSGLFKSHELNLLRAFADQAAVAIQNARLFEAARARLAEITEVRDLMNRIFESVASGLITLDRDGRVTQFNPAAERITGLPAANALGHPLSSLIPVFAHRINPHWQDLRAGSEARHLELEVEYDARGPRFWTVVLSPLHSDEAGVAGVAMVLDDRTDDRRREQQVNQVRKYLPLALVENLRSADMAALGGQEREITVLFCDLRGFTRFSERLEPEEVMQIVNRYLAVATDAISAHGGLVDKYLGDAVTGLFNTSLNPQPDHTLRALHSARDLCRAVNALHAGLPPEQRLAFGVGLHTGMAVLGNVGSADRQEFTAMGEAVDVARLLQEHGAGGDIILSAAAHAVLGDHVQAEALPESGHGPMFRVKQEKVE